MNEAEKDEQPIIEPDAGEQKESVKIEVTEPMTGESNGEQMIEAEAHEEPETITEIVAEEKPKSPLPLWISKLKRQSKGKYSPLPQLQLRYQCLKRQKSNKTAAAY